MIAPTATSDNPDSQKATFCQLRNCMQQCPIVNRHRQGQGIIVTDDGAILLGQWHHNHLDGWYAYLTENSQSYGFMAAGSLHGFNIVQVNENLTICGHFHKNFAHGTCLVTTADKYQVTKFKHGYRQEILERGSYNRQTVYELINRLFNGQIIGLRKFMACQLEQSGNAGGLAEIQINSLYRYYGFVNQDITQGEGLGMVFKNDVLYNYGYYKGTQLCGLGRLYVKDQIHDGIFYEGVLRGEGIKYDYSSNQYSCGMHSDNNLDFQRGYGFPTQLIRKIHKMHHLRAVEFQNEIVVMDRLVRIKIGDITPEYKDDKSEVATTYSAKRKMQKSPSQRTTYSTRPAKFQVSDNSPLKRMLKEYERQVDSRTPKSIDRQSRSPARSKQKSIYGSDEEEDVRVRKEEVKSKQIYHRPTNEDSLVVKDTFSMIRHMEEVERNRREEIDKIQKGKYRNIRR